MSQRAACPALTQELHFRASVRVARLLTLGGTDRRRLLTAAMSLTEARTRATRRKASATVLTRLGLGRRRRVEASGLHRLLAELPEPAGRQLLTYVVASREQMLSRLVTEVLHPYFVDRTTPEGLTTEEFSALNANGLFDAAGAITHAAVAEYARRRWRIENPSPTGRALRVLRKGGVLGSAWLSRTGGRCLGYFPIVNLPDIACFAYVLYSMREEGDYVRVDRVRADLFARLFMLRPIAVDYLLEQASATGLISDARSEIAELPLGSLEDAAGAILDAHRAGR